MIYTYSLLNIYSGKFYELTTKKVYKNGTILKGEFEVKEMIGKKLNKEEK